MSGADRQATAHVDCDALRHNLARVRAAAPGSAVFAAVKADAYGHGALTVASALTGDNGVDGLAVASLDEALALRWGGIGHTPIMLLSAPLTHADLALCSEQGFEPVLFDAHQWTALLDWRGATLRVWPKLDTGMHRLGLPAADAPAIAERLRANPALEIAGWLTHLACADERDNNSTPRQLECFARALEGQGGPRSAANSAGILGWPQSHLDVVRPGIMLYGGSPLLGTSAADLGLEPVMTLRAPVISLREVAAGESVGYGAQWTADRPSRVAVLAIGYGDGYPRHLPNGTPVLIHGRRCPLIGRVSMDMISVDVTDVPEVSIGEMATLWGAGLPADEIAVAAGTIAYELFCQLTPRVAFTSG